MSHAANLTKYNCQFNEGPKGLKLNWDYTREMSKCDTAQRPKPSLRNLVSIAHSRCHDYFSFPQIQAHEGFRIGASDLI